MGRQYKDTGITLISTKFYVPQPPPGLVHRQRLILSLGEGSQRRLTLLCAPAGSGKTALLSAWISAREEKRNENIFSPALTAWLSLDEGDDYPTRFWTYFIAALQRIKGNLGKEALSFLHGPGQNLEPFPSEAMLTLLINDLSTFPEEITFVLDDYHLIGDPVIHQGMTFLLDHLPPRMHLVLASRMDPPLPLARYRARSQMTELRDHDMRFSLDEAGAFLTQSMRLDLPPEDIATLERRTEGWIVGLQAAALSIQGREDPHAFVQSFSGSQRYVMDFLIEEVFQRQPESIQTFLLKTAILDRLCGPLCDALTGKSDGQARLEQLERANLFLVPLDERRRWFRYHPLFADLLRVRLQQTDPGLVPALHHKAAAWYEAAGLIGEAIHHALAASEAVWAARLVEQYAEELLRRGDGATFREWLSRLPSEVVHTRPRLAMAQAIAAFNVGRLSAVEPLLVEAEHALQFASNEADDPSIDQGMNRLVNLPASIALLRASLAGWRGDAEQMRTLALWAQAHLAEGEPGRRISIIWNLATADWMVGRLVEAGRAFAGLFSDGREAGSPHLILTAAYSLGHIQSAQGFLNAAYRTYRESLEYVAQMGSEKIPSAAYAHLGLAEVLYERNQLETALHHVQEAISGARQTTSAQVLANGLARLAWVRQAMGDPVGARQSMEEAYQVIPSREIIAFHNLVPTQRARLLLAQGNLTEVGRWVEERDLDARHIPAYPREPEYLMLARLLLVHNRLEEALTLLDRLGKQARAQARAGSLIEIEVLHSLGLKAAGQSDQAMQVLFHALARAEPEGYLRTFVDEGESLRLLLVDCRVQIEKGWRASVSEANSISSGTIEKLLSAFPPEGAFATLHQSTTSNLQSSIQIEPLSLRELEVLRLLAKGASNQEIAQELTIALTTARKHVSNILGKLGVANRTQAVSRGRDLGLL